jgi:hypothetical protein
MLLLFIFLRIFVEKILKAHPYKEDIDFILSFLIFFSQSLIGAIIYLYYNCKKKEPTQEPIITGKRISKIGTITLIMNKSYEINDSRFKKISLIIFASFFNFVGSIIRSDDAINFGEKEENNSQLEIRIRSIQIIISSLLCYFTLRLNIYKHQKLSLIIISLFLVFLIIIELIIASNKKNKILSMLIVIMSCLSRAFLDVTEKYLFDYNYINILSMLIYEGLIGIFLFIIFFIVNKSYQTEGRNILIDMSHFNWQLITFILLIILYTVISGFRNAYRVTTNKYYSPMSRALFESTLDPFLFLYNFLTFYSYDEGSKKWIYFSTVLFCLLVIAFFSLVYNDFIIFYCYGLEYNTYSEINRRINLDNARRLESEDSVIDRNISEEKLETSLEMGNIE